MKNLFLSFVVFSVLLLIGCQENSITDPVTTKELNKGLKSEKTNSTGYIPLGDQLQDPRNPSNYLNVNGVIEYEHKLIIVDPIPPAPQYYVSVSLSIEAAITSNDQPAGIQGLVSTTSEDVFYVSEEGIYTLDKVYEVEGLTEGMMLICRFFVTTDGLGLHSMWLYIAQDCMF